MPSSITPTVRAIVDAIRHKIADGAYVRGEPLPAELELAASLSVSRGSVRKAIEFLVEEGDLVRRQHARPVIAGGRTESFAGRTDIYVWVAQTVADESSLPFIQGVSRGLSGTSYRMVVREPSLNMGTIIQSDEKRFLTDLVREPAVAGAIIWRDAFADNTEEFRQLLNRHIPTVFVDSPAPSGLAADHVGTANVASARRCVEHLLEMGHQRIVCVTDTETSVTLNDRVKGYRRAMRQFGLESVATCVMPGPREDEAADDPLGGIYAPVLSKSSLYLSIAHRVVNRILAMDPLPTALFVGYDILAYWICAVLEGRGIHIPEQMSVVGFDWRAHWDKKLADALTTASQDFEGFGRHAADLLLDRIAGEAPAAPRHILLDAPLIVSTSTAPPAISRLGPGRNPG